MKALCSSGTLVDAQETTWPYIPEDGTRLMPILLKMN
jgi:hypothetical protein